MTALTDLMAEIRDWADRQDLTDSQVHSWIYDAEDRMNYELRVKEMINVDQAVVVDNKIDYPAKYLEAHYIRLLPNPQAAAPNSLMSQGSPVRYVSNDEYYQIVGNPFHPKHNQPFFTDIGTTLAINPQITVLNQTQVEIAYYAKIPALVEFEDNPVVDVHKRIYRFAALGAGAAFLYEDDRLPLWESNATSLIQKANDAWLRAKTSGGPLNMRFRTFG